MGEAVKVEKILFSNTVFPKAEVIANCGACGVELVRLPWNSYFDYSRKCQKIKKDVDVCPVCKKIFKEGAVANPPRWERDEKGRMIAKCKNGDFMVWKDGRGYKWRWRIYGGVYANHLGWSPTKKAAMEMCEKHSEWKKGGKEE